MSDFYTILINDDHSFTHAVRKRIMHRSNNIDSIKFLVKPTYNGFEYPLDMSKVNVVVQYVTPISRTYKPVILKPEKELYKNRVQYILPITIDMTKEVGELELTINFSYLLMKDEGFIEQVRPLGYTSLTIEETKNWSDYIPESDLDNIAQMMLLNQSVAEQNRINIELMNESMVKSLKRNEADNTLYLVNEDGVQIGEAVSADLGDCDCEYGIPVVDFTIVEPEKPDDELVDNVVEF